VPDEQPPGPLSDMRLGSGFEQWRTRRAHARIARLEAAIAQAEAELEALATDGAWGVLDDDPFTAADGRAALASADAMRGALERLRQDLDDARRHLAHRQ